MWRFYLYFVYLTFNLIFVGEDEHASVDNAHKCYALL